MPEKLLRVKNLKTSFFTHYGEVRAVRDVSFVLEKGESLGIVGESGSGKTATALSIMKLIESPGRIIDSEILYKGENLIDKSEKEMMSVRGGEIAMIFQDPTTSLNPVYTIGNQIIETIMKHKRTTKKTARKMAAEMLSTVGIHSPLSRMDQYPHEFSVGMRQRVMIAMALSCGPDLLIADEPTSALDVTIQAQILELLDEIREDTGTSILLITHDLGVVAEACSKVMVMYGGLIMESGRTRDVFEKPMHPYTRGLLESVPRMEADKNARLKAIEGSPIDLSNPGKGCPFCPRCPHAMKICKIEKPEYKEMGSGHKSMCWLLNEDAPDYAVKNFFEGGRP
jgi:oligopeptide transport system ATP-binding protein